MDQHDSVWRRVLKSVGALPASAEFMVGDTVVNSTNRRRAVIIGVVSSEETPYVEAVYEDQDRVDWIDPRELEHASVIVQAQSLTRVEPVRGLEDTRVSNAFQGWTERLKVYNDYIRALAEYRRQVAEAERQKAAAENELATVRVKDIVIEQLKRDLNAFDGEKRAQREEITRINRRGEYAQLLLQGRQIHFTTYHHAWRSYKWFESKALLESGKELYAVEVKDEALSSGNFINNHNQNTDPDPAPSEVHNPLQLMDWLNEQRYLVRSGSEAQRTVLALFQAINSIATAMVNDIRTRMTEMVNKTYDTWNLRAILGVSENTAAKRIQEVGTSQGAGGARA